MTKSSLLFVSMCAITPSLHGTISTVYNLRIAETTKLNAGIQQDTNTMTAATLFNQWRTSRDATQSTIGGGMASLVYIPSALYARVDVAVANVHNETTHFTRTQPDDVLLSTGYSVTLNDRTKMTFSGLLGLPTHQDESLDHIQFGYGHVGLGLQADNIYVYSANKRHTLRSAARAIYFLPQIVPALNNDGKLQNFRFGNGILTDLFIAHTSSIAHHKIEVGYNPTFLYGAVLMPNIQDAIIRNEHTRHNIYGTYRYAFFLKNITSALTGALSYGFDSSPKLFGYKRIFSTWISWTIDF